MQDFRKKTFSIRREGNHGFTIIELLVTVAIVAVLSAGIISLVGSGPRQKGRDSRRKADIQKIASALELYKADLGGYPGSLNTLTTVVAPATRPYLSVIPTDPSPPYSNYTYTPSGCGGGFCSGFTLCTNLESVTPNITNCPDYSISNQ